MDNKTLDRLQEKQIKEQAVEEKILTAKRSPQLRLMEDLLKKVGLPFRHAFSDIATNRVRKEGTWQEAQEMYGKLCMFLTEELNFKTPNIPVIISEEVPTQGPAWLVCVAGSQINLSTARKDMHITIAYAVDGDIKCCLSYAPIEDAFTIIEKGMGVDGPHMKLRVSGWEEFNNRVIGIFSPITRTEDDSNFLRIFSKLRQENCHVRIQGNPIADALDIAAGRLDGYIALNIQEKDVMMMNFIIKEASGRTSDIDGNSINLESVNIVAGNKKIHPKILMSIQ